ncbi:MAG: OB-fold nucleic acid binding domain-containing protein, partial [Bacilli bacterium]|nr:OB-fold nucleic acid binding domain-containing protein [Bacilli bacterium]
ENSINYANFSQFLGDNLVERSYSDEEYSFEEISAHERSALGFNLKYSLFSRYQDYLKQVKAVEIENLKIQKNVRVLFALRRIQKIVTKKNQEMAFLTIYDDTDEMDAVMFPSTYESFKHHLELNSIYLGEGNIEERNGKKQYIIKILKPMK